MVYAWDLTMATGNASVDNEHRQLIGKFNDLLEAMKSGKGRDDIAKILAFLTQYVDEHFRHEEALFARLNCPEKLANLKAHAAFRETMRNLSERLRNEGATTSLTLDVKSRLAEWFINHIKTIDTKLGLLAKAA